MARAENLTENIIEQVKLLNEDESEAVLSFIHNLLRKETPESAERRAKALQALRKLQEQAGDSGLTEDILQNILTDNK